MMNRKVIVSIGAGTFFSSKAHLLFIDLNTKKVDNVFSYTHKVYEQSTKGFTGLYTIDPSRLLVCTEAELMIFNLSTFSVEDYISSNFFNDLHYAFHDIESNTYYVVNTGLDSVEVLDQNFMHVKTIFLVPGLKYIPKTFRIILSSLKKRLQKKNIQYEANSRFGEDKRYKNLTESIKFDKIRKSLLPRSLYNHIDLRYVLFRPHILHPNFISKVGEHFLVTLKNTGEVIDLITKQVIIKDLKGPHDGIYINNTFLLTESGTGKLHIYDNIRNTIDLKRSNPSIINVCNPKEGFIRGVDLLDENNAVVAVSKRREIQDEKPSWIARINLKTRTLHDLFEIPVQYGTNPFSVIKAH